MRHVNYNTYDWPKIIDAWRAEAQRMTELARKPHATAELIAECFEMFIGEVTIDLRDGTNYFIARTGFAFRPLPEALRMIADDIDDGFTEEPPGDDVAAKMRALAYEYDIVARSAERRAEMGLDEPL